MTFEALFQSIYERAAARKDAPRPKPVKVSKRRRADFDTHCVNGHPWSAENTYRYPTGKRHCRACNREGQRRRYERRTHGKGSHE